MKKKSKILQKTYFINVKIGNEKIYPRAYDKHTFNKKATVMETEFEHERIHNGYIGLT